VTPSCPESWSTVTEPRANHVQQFQLPGNHLAPQLGVRRNAKRTKGKRLVVSHGSEKQWKRTKAPPSNRPRCAAPHRIVLPYPGRPRQAAEVDLLVVGGIDGTGIERPVTKAA
jgi:hypothetical protein